MCEYPVSVAADANIKPNQSAMITITNQTAITNNSQVFVLINEAGELIAEYATLQAAVADNTDLGFGPSAKILAPGEDWVVKAERHIPTAKQKAEDAALLEAMFAGNA